jgi:hypothetical protein
MKNKKMKLVIKKTVKIETGLKPAIKPLVTDNGCSFFIHCLAGDWTKTGECSCFQPIYYLGKLKEKCVILDAKRRRLEELLEHGSKQPRENKSKGVLPVVEPGKRASGVAEVYLSIFDSFDKDPLNDTQIADRLFALTGIRPNSKNISSYRCMYNAGKVKGQIKAPDKQIERIKGKFKKIGKEVNMAKKIVIKKGKDKKPTVKREAGGETKESKLVKLLSGKEMFTLDEIVSKTGFAPASAKMYVSQDYLDRKEKPYKIFVGKKGSKEAYRMEVRKGK